MPIAITKQRLTLDDLPGQLVRPAAQEVHLWVGRIDRRSEVLEALSNLLSVDEKARAGRFVFDKHRERFVWARGALRQLLSRYLGMAPESLCFSYSEYGKPMLLSGDGSPGLAFNLSHSSEIAVYALTSGAEVGVDVERIRENIKAIEIARHFFSLPEQEALAALPEVKRVAGFFNCWACKEAFVKAVGQGLSHPLDSFVVDSSDENKGMLSLNNSADEARQWWVERFEVDVGYKAAFAVKFL